MSTAQGYDYRTTFRYIHNNNALGAPLHAGDDGYKGFLFPGTDKMSSETGPTAQTIAAITEQCFKKPEEKRVAGASGKLFQGCPIVSPEFLACLAFGYTEEVDALGNTNLALAKPGSDECEPCDPSDPTNQDWGMIEGICVVDCNNKVVGRRLNVIRSISTFELSRQLRKGGKDVNALGADMNIQLDENTGYGEGPGDLVESYDPLTGLPDCNPQVCVDTDFDFSAIEAVCGACDAEYFGCLLTPGLIAANPVLDIPMITG